MAFLRNRLGVLSGTTMVMIGSLSFVGCSNDDDNICDDTVGTRVDEDVDFEDYETFAIADTDMFEGADGLGGSAQIPDDVQTNIEAANDEAAAQLEERGLTEVDPDKETPDLWIVSAAATEEEEGTYWACSPGPGWGGWYSYWYWDPCEWLDPIDFNYTDGTLILALVDSSLNEPVFAGGVEGVLQCSEDLDSRIESAVDEMFDAYPD